MIGVLVFHRVLSHGKGDRFTIRSEELRHILETLQGSGAIVEPRDISQPLDHDHNSFVLSFDDGTSDHWSVVSPALHSQQLKGLFFVSTGDIGTQGHLSRGQIVEMHRAGHGIGAHSHRHVPLTNLAREDIDEEVRRSVWTLEDILGAPIEWFAPPEGMYDRRVAEAATNQNIRFFRTTSFGWNTLSAGYAMVILKAFTISSFFQKAQLQRCLASKAVFYRYFLLYGVKNLVKKGFPNLYRGLRKTAGY